MKATFPDATDVVVITVSIGLLPRRARAQRHLRRQRVGCPQRHPQLVKHRRRDPPRGSGVPPGLVIQSWRHDPDIRFARYDHTYDEGPGRLTSSSPA
jgi:hypothetical protein